MEGDQSLAHSRYDGKYHLVFVPKMRRKKLSGKIREYLKGVFHELARQKGSVIVSGHMSADQVRRCIEIPPKYAVAEVVGYLKGKSALAVARHFGKRENFLGENLWVRGYAVSTVGFELGKVKAYIESQEKLESAPEAGRF